MQTSCSALPPRERDRRRGRAARQPAEKAFSVHDTDTGLRDPSGARLRNSASRGSAGLSAPTGVGADPLSAGPVHQTALLPKFCTGRGLGHPPRSTCQGGVGRRGRRGHINPCSNTAKRYAQLNVSSEESEFFSH